MVDTAKGLWLNTGMTQTQKPYKVHATKPRYFATMREAQLAATAIYGATGHIVAITKEPAR